MGTSSCLTAVTLASVLLAAAAPAGAGRIPLGINSSHGIFVQELWQGREPYLCLANRSGKDQVVQVSRWKSRQVPAEPLLQWSLDADSTHCHGASRLAAERLLEFSLVDGERLGLLQAPRIPPTTNEAPAVFASLQGPNGACSVRGTWMEQSALWLQAGESASVTLQTSGGSGQPVFEFPVDSGLKLPHLQIESADSSSLVVEREDQRFIVTGGQRAATPTVHQLRLVFDVPPVTAPSMYLLSGRKRFGADGWQCFVRGIPVRP